MPAVINTLITTGLQGAQFTLNGSGFGVADPDSFLFLFPNAAGLIEDITGLVTLWSNVQIVGILPTDLTEGNTAFLFTQLVGETTGTSSPTFGVGPQQVMASADLPTDTVVEVSKANAKDIMDNNILVSKGSAQPVGVVDTYLGSDIYRVRWVEDIQASTPTYVPQDVYKADLGLQGKLSSNAQVAQGTGFYRYQGQ